MRAILLVHLFGYEAYPLFNRFQPGETTMPRRKKDLSTPEAEAEGLETEVAEATEEAPAPAPEEPRGKRGRRAASASEFENARPSLDPGRRNAIDKALSDLTKRFGDGTIMRLGEATHMNVEVIPPSSRRRRIEPVRGRRAAV